MWSGWHYAGLNPDVLSVKGITRASRVDADVARSGNGNVLGVLPARDSRVCSAVAVVAVVVAAEVAVIWAAAPAAVAMVAAT